MSKISRVAVFWDIENCAIPATVNGGAAVQYIESVAREYGICSPFRAYASMSEGIAYSKRSDLVTAGVSLIPTHVKMADHVLITDMLEWAFDNPDSSTIVLVTGDKDFSYTISLLRRRRIQVVLIGASPARLRTMVNSSVPVTAPKAVANSSFAAQASRVVEWKPGPIIPAKVELKRKIATPFHAPPPLPSVEADEPGRSSSCPSQPHSGTEDDAQAAGDNQYTPATEPATKPSPPMTLPSKLGLVLNPATPPFVPKCTPAPTAPSHQPDEWVVAVSTNGSAVDVVTARCFEGPPNASLDPATIPLPCTPESEAASLPLPQSPETVKPSLPSPEPSPAAGPTPLLPPGLEHHIQSLRTPPASHNTSESELEEEDVEHKCSAIEDNDTAWLRPVMHKVQKSTNTGGSQSASWRRSGVDIKHESTRAKRANLSTVPTPYQPLVEALEGLAQRGHTRPLWSALGGFLCHRKQDIFAQLGVNNMKEYLHSAQQAGWCLLGETNIPKGGEWIELAYPRRRTQIRTTAHW